MHCPVFVEKLHRYYHFYYHYVVNLDYLKVIAQGSEKTVHAFGARVDVQHLK